MVGKIKRGDFNSALARGLEVIRLFSDNRPHLSTSEAASMTGLSRPAARRFLLTLTELGYLRLDNETFWPQPKLLDLGYTYVSTWSLSELVTPYLRAVVDKLQENCSFAVLDGSDVVYVARSETRRIVQSITMSVGTRVPAAVSALGRVLLAFSGDEVVEEFLSHNALRPVTSRTVTDPTLFRERLDVIRKQRWAMVDGEFEEGLISIATPIFIKQGEVLAAINVGGPKSRVTPEHMKKVFLPVLQSAASAISDALARSGREFSPGNIVRITV